MKSVHLNSTFSHNNMRIGLGVCFLIIISVSILSYSTIWDDLTHLLYSIPTLIKPGNLLGIGIPVFITTLGYPYMLFRQKNKTEKLRMKLASDLHDDLGSLLNSVSIYTDLALIKGETTYLRKIKEGTQEAISGIRNIIWQLDDKDTSFSNLISRINAFASFLCQIKQIGFRVEIEKEAYHYELHEEEKRNLYMVIKEAINNSVKYADASEIILSIKLEKGKPVIVIKDNGKGFLEVSSSTGNGIRNMKTRAACIRYQISIQAVGGTVIRLQKK